MRICTSMLKGCMILLLTAFTAGCVCEEKDSAEAGDGRHGGSEKSGHAVKEKPTQSSKEEDPGYYGNEKQQYVANSFCEACHIDFQNEELVTIHKEAGIGCERCHGESEAHRSDEENITPPEIMYPKDKINPTCMMCHPRHHISHVGAHEVLLAEVETIFSEEGKTSGTEVKKPNCTECHGENHRMKRRTNRWNKATGELLERG